MTERDLEGWTIAFDLDGTLVETAPDLIGTLNRMLAARDIPRMPVEAAQHLVGHGALALLRHGFQEAGAAWDEAGAPALLQEFLDEADLGGDVLIDAFADLEAAIDGLSAAPYVSRALSKA